jgi:hypothetical protein
VSPPQRTDDRQTVSHPLHRQAKTWATLKHELIQSFPS